MTRTPCTMGVGCDETGVCYAEAHDQPERCPRGRFAAGGIVPDQPDDKDRVRVLLPGEWWHPDRELVIRRYGEELMNRLNAVHFPLDPEDRVGQTVGTGGDPMTNALPDVAYCRDLEDRRKVLVLMRGHTGYWDEGHYDTEAEAEARVKELNRGFGVTSAQLIAMKIGSRFGFDVQGADPARHEGQHDDEAGDSVAAPSESEMAEAIRAAVRHLNEVSRRAADVGVLFEFDPLCSRYANGAVTYSVTITKRL